MNTITKRLESDLVIMYDARVMFNSAIEQELMAIKRLGADAPIVKNVAFQKAIVKIQSEIEDSPTANERRAVVHLIRNRSTVSGAVCRREWGICDESPESKKRRAEKTFNSAYLNLEIIHPTYNICERVFSLAGYALEERREIILSVTFECQLFLRVNGRILGSERSLCHRKMIAYCFPLCDIYFGKQ